MILERKKNPSTGHVAQLYQEASKHTENSVLVKYSGWKFSSITPPSQLDRGEKIRWKRICKF